jgi:hypothetical protein
LRVRQVEHAQLLRPRQHAQLLRCHAGHAAADGELVQAGEGVHQRFKLA